MCALSAVLVEHLKTYVTCFFKVTWLLMRNLTLIDIHFHVGDDTTLTSGYFYVLFSQSLHTK